MWGMTTDRRRTSKTRIEWPQRCLISRRRAPVQNRHVKFAGSIQPLMVDSAVQDWAQSGVEMAKKKTIALNIFGNGYIKSVADLANNMGHPEKSEQNCHPQQRIGQATAAFEGAIWRLGFVLNIVLFGRWWNSRLSL